MAAPPPAPDPPNGTEAVAPEIAPRFNTSPSPGRSRTVRTWIGMLELAQWANNLVIFFW